MRLDKQIKSLKSNPVKLTDTDEDKLVQEFELFEKEYQDLAAKVEAAETTEEKAEILQGQLDELGIDQKTFGNIYAQMEAGANPDEVLKNGLNIVLSVFLKTQMDETTIPDGYRQMDEFIDIIMYDNGSMVNDYQDYLPVNAINPFHGSQKGDPNGQWTDLTVSDGELITMESYGVSHIVHKQALTYSAMFTSVHKNALFFAKQLNFLKKKVGQPILDVLLSIKTKLLLTNFQGEQDIVDGQDSITFKPTAIGDPDITITGTSMAEVIGKFNTWERGLSTPSRKHFPAGSKSESLFALSFDGGKTNTQLKRSFDINSLKVITPLGFIEAYDKGILAGSFNMDKAEINAVKSTLRPRNLELLCSDEYANITGVETSLINGDLMKATGSADLFVIAGKPFPIIQKFKSSNVFPLPNNTTAVNAWFNYGLGIHKWEKMGFWHVRITVAPATNPTPSDQKVETSTQKETVATKAATNPTPSDQKVETSTQKETVATKAATKSAPEATKDDKSVETEAE